MAPPSGFSLVPLGHPQAWFREKVVLTEQSPWAVGGRWELMKRHRFGSFASARFVAEIGPGFASGSGENVGPVRSSGIVRSEST